MKILNLIKERIKEDPNYQIMYLVRNKPTVVDNLVGKGKYRGIGFTRKSREQSKKRRKMARASRKINRK